MAVKIIYHGHANVEIHSGNYRVQIDPFYTSNPLADVKAEAVNPTHILISHAHFDHMEDALAIAKRTGAVIASNFEIANYLSGKGAPKTHGMNHGGGWAFEFGRVTMTLAFHTSSFPDGSYGGQPCGWVIEIGDKTIYHAGDTALFKDMELIGELWDIDVACLPIGDNFTMGPAHAIKAAEMLRCKRVLPMHYDTFPPIKQDVARFCAALKAGTEIACEVIKPGQAIEL